MEDRKAIAVLRRPLEKGSLDSDEKEAVLAAIGILSWTSLSKARITAQKTRRDKSTKWQSQIG